MSEVKWPAYDWEKYGAPLHCEESLDDLPNHYVTDEYNIIDPDGVFVKHYLSKEAYMCVVAPWLDMGAIKLTLFDHTPFEGNI